jgi:GMP synthase (glutamine-hydrolysing)
MRPSVLVLTHAPNELAGTIGEVLVQRGVPMRTIRAYAGETVPSDLEGVLGLVVMGGPQGVYEADRYPFLRDEMRLIERAVALSKPVLGVCLGSQLLAAALGSEVRPGPSKEIGWAKVRLTEAALRDPLFKGIESSFTAFHWHGDVFTLPPSGVSLARSEKTEHQAFRYGAAAYGVLFHIEMTAALVAGMLSAFGDEARAAGVEPDAIVRGCDDNLPALVARGKDVFASWAALLGRERESARP